MNRKKSDGKRWLCTSTVLTAVIILSVFTIGIGILPASAQISSVNRYLPDSVQTSETFTVALTQTGFLEPLNVGVVTETLPEDFEYVEGSYVGGAPEMVTYEPATRTLKVPFKEEYTITYDVKASSYEQTAVFLGTYRALVGDPFFEDGTVGGDTVVVVGEEGADTTPPVVSNPTADPDVIPDDTDNNPLWGESSTLTVTVTDESAITSVTIDLSSIGGSAVQPMTNTGGDVWAVSTNASAGTAGWTGMAYVPYPLQVTATDEHANSNTSVCINLTVMKNGDVSSDGVTDSWDCTYLARHIAGIPGYTMMVDEVADVSGDSIVDSWDCTYLARHIAGIPGYDKLK